MDEFFPALLRPMKKTINDNDIKLPMLNNLNLMKFQQHNQLERQRVAEVQRVVEELQQNKLV